MSPEEERLLRRLMDYEAARSAPPEGFPALPDIPCARYTDPRFFALERSQLFGRSWLLAAHMDEIPEPGRFVLWERAGPGVLIVHGEDGTVRAFHNVCRHRGAPLVNEPGGSARRFVCAYHGWSYALDGRLLALRENRDFRDFDPACRGLVPLGCERYGRLVFVNFAADAPGLRVWLGPLAREWEEFGFDRARLSLRASFVVECNWKLAMEANLEVYHVPTIHRDTVAPILDPRRNVNTLYPFGHGRMVAPNPRAGTRARAAAAPPRPQFESVGPIARSCTQSYNLFPNLVVPLNQYLQPPLLFWPEGIGRCRIETWTLAPDWGDGDGPDMWTENRGERLGRILREDIETCERIQRALGAGAASGFALGYQEARIYHWHQSADQLIGPDAVPAELRVEPVLGEEWIYPGEPRLALL